jgi:hypothetical protein
MKIINQIISYIIGGLFIFSGLIKLNDPIGMAIKLEEYFEVFSTDKAELGLAYFKKMWEVLEPYSLSLAVILSVLEVVWGISLIIKYRYKSTLWALFLMIIFFTFLTFYSAWFNKVTDCGCFGDAIKLTPWQSFTKDVVLLIMIAFLLFQKRPLGNVTVGYWKIGVSLASMILSTGLAWYAIEHLPPLDFRPYKIGSNIPKNMQNSGEPRYGAEEYIYTNLKTGKDESYPKWNNKLSDTTLYKYKAYNRPLLNPEVLPKIKDYRVSTASGEDITQKTFEGKKLLIIIYEVKRTNPAPYKKIIELAQALAKKKIEAMILTGDDEATFENFRHEYQINIPYHFVDKTVLKTMIRANPGIMYWENGIVKNMWHYNDLPSETVFDGK